MRNHNEKPRDMARSVLPSKARKAAREERRTAHHRERARGRHLLHSLRGFDDPDDFEGVVGVSGRHRHDIAAMVIRRREADKIGPLLQWAERSVERDPVLAAAATDARVVYFRKLLPSGLVGNHALGHLRWVLDDVRAPHGEIERHPTGRSAVAAEPAT